MPAMPSDHQTSERRMPRRVWTAISGIARLLVEREEDVLEVGLAAVEPEHAIPGERLHERVGLALEHELDHRAAALDLAHAGKPGEGVGRRRRVERHLHA